jgi:hypothetical protein
MDPFFVRDFASGQPFFSLDCVRLWANLRVGKPIGTITHGEADAAVHETI